MKSNMAIHGTKNELLKYVKAHFSLEKRVSQEVNRLPETIQSDETFIKSGIGEILYYEIVSLEVL